MLNIGKSHVESHMCKTTHDNEMLYFKVFCLLATLSSCRFGWIFFCTVAPWNSLPPRPLSPGSGHVGHSHGRRPPLPTVGQNGVRKSVLVLRIFMVVEEKWIKLSKNGSVGHWNLGVCSYISTSLCFDRFPQISEFHFLILRNLFLILRCLQKTVDCRQMALDLRSQSFMAMLELPPKRPS